MCLSGHDGLRTASMWRPVLALFFLPTNFCLSTTDRISLSGLNSFSSKFSVVSKRRSPRDSFVSDIILLFVLMTFSCEKTHSNLPLDAYKENSSSTRIRTLDHSHKEDALNSLQQTVQ